MIKPLSSSSEKRQVPIELQEHLPQTQQNRWPCYLKAGEHLEKDVGHRWQSGPTDELHAHWVFLEHCHPEASLPYSLRKGTIMTCTSGHWVGGQWVLLDEGNFCNLSCNLAMESNYIRQSFPETWASETGQIITSWLLNKWNMMSWLSFNSSKCLGSHLTLSLHLTIFLQVFQNEKDPRW